jgi:hypothetical protein
MPETLKDPHNVPQLLANGPIFIAKVGDMNVVTFTQVVGRAEETLIGSSSKPTLDHIVICRVAMTNRVLTELASTVGQAQVAAAPAAGRA